MTETLPPLPTVPPVTIVGISDPTIVKDAFKEAMKEWLDEQAEKVGYWSIKTIVGMGVGALIYFILVTNGWHK